MAGWRPQPRPWFRLDLERAAGARSASAATRGAWADSTPRSHADALADTYADADADAGSDARAYAEPDANPDTAAGTVAGANAVSDTVTGAAARHLRQPAAGSNGRAVDGD